MNEPFQLVTNCTFKGKDYLVQMCVLNSKKLELIVTDKLMAEDWQCEYDASYIEALTHKTGNYKQFGVFITMLKSGLLKTSESITLDLLTIEDLEELRSKKVISSYSSSRSSQSSNLNKRYLILTYSVEFDRIHYPLPLDYCGPPNPTVLQSNIRRLEAEIERLKQKNINMSKADSEETKKFKEKIETLTKDNTFLSTEVRRLNKLLSSKMLPIKNAQALHNSLRKLEERVHYEKKSNRQTINKLKAENKLLTQQVEELKKRELQLKSKLRNVPKHISYRNCRRTFQSDRGSQNPVDAKNRIANEQVEPLPSQTVLSCPSPTIIKSKKVKPKKIQNRFISSSSSESELIEPRRGRSRETKQFLTSKKPMTALLSEKFRKHSSERSRVSSEDDKEKIGSLSSNHSVGGSNSQDRKTNKLIATDANYCRNKAGSRDSSLSSRCSSKHSRRSKIYNRGSGDHQSIDIRITPRTLENSKEDMKFSMSDLETRIHALQKLLSEGLNM